MNKRKKSTVEKEKDAIVESVLPNESRIVKEYRDAKIPLPSELVMIDCDTLLFDENPEVWPSVSAMMDEAMFWYAPKTADGTDRTVVDPIERLLSFSSALLEAKLEYYEDRLIRLKINSDDERQIDACENTVAQLKLIIKRYDALRGVFNTI